MERPTGSGESCSAGLPLSSRTRVNENGSNPSWTTMMLSAAVRAQGSVQKGGRTPVVPYAATLFEGLPRPRPRVAAEPSPTVSIAHSDRAMTQVRQLERCLTDPRARPKRSKESPPAFAANHRRRSKQGRPTQFPGERSFRSSDPPGSSQRSHWGRRPAARRRPRPAKRGRGKAEPTTESPGRHRRLDSRTSLGAAMPSVQRAP